MADISHQLMIKYGLDGGPSPEQCRRWASRTRSLIAAGVSPARAGQQAAEEVFPDCGTCLYKSEADTIEVLLMLAERK